MNAVKLFGTSDLYGILEVDKNSTINQIKKSYYRLALIYHPDKTSEENKMLAAEKFIYIHQAYHILSNSESKMKYDAEGAKVIFARATIAAEWENHLKIINEEDFNNASHIYKGSSQEKYDVLKEFIAGNGSMISVMNSIPFMRKEDETRIIGIIKEAIEKKEIPCIRIKKLPKNY